MGEGERKSGWEWEVSTWGGDLAVPCMYRGDPSHAPTPRPVPLFFCCCCLFVWLVSVALDLLACLALGNRQSEELPHSLPFLFYPDRPDT